MKTDLDCLPCFLKQAFDAARTATTDPDIQHQIVIASMKRALDMPFSLTPIHITQQMYRIAREISGTLDPYHSVKQEFNRRAMDMYPMLKEKVRQSSKPFETAVRLAVAGNIIDFGLLKAEDIDLGQTVEDALTYHFAIDDFDELQAAVSRAKTILYIADNSGEIAFDRILIEELPLDKVTVFTRGFPTINDATLEDAEMVGLTRIVTVKGNGSDAPGTLIDDCSDEFQEMLKSADLIISKGQGNYETLEHLRNPNLFFLLKVKCMIIARELGCPIGSIVCMCNKPAAETSSR